MKVSLTNIINNIFFQNEDIHSSILTKLDFFNKNINYSFKGIGENLIRSYFFNNLNLIYELKGYFAQNIDLEKVYSKHFIYFENLIYILIMENLEFDQDFEYKKYKVNNYSGSYNELFFNNFDQVFSSIVKFKKDFNDFFLEEFTELKYENKEFFESFRHLEGFFEDFDIFDSDHSVNFYSKYLLSIAQIVFSEYYDQQKYNERIKKLEHILNNFDFVDQDDFVIQFFESVFFEPYKLLLKIKSIFDYEIKIEKKQKNDGLLISIILMSSQIFLYKLEYSAKILRNLVSVHISNDQSKILVEFSNLINGFIKSNNNSKWTSGLLFLIEKIGIEIENYEDHTEKLFRLINLEIVSINKIEKHHSSDSLNICDISNGFRVVCGGKNVHFINSNSYNTLYAPIGSYLPNDMLIIPRDIRGFVSLGMLCSLNEICSDGINIKNINWDSNYDDNLRLFNEIKINKEQGDSGIIVLGNNDSQYLSTYNGYIGRYFSFHSISEISLTPNLGYLVGELNLIDQIKIFLMNNKKIHKKNYNQFQITSEFDIFKNIFNKDFSIDIQIEDHSRSKIKNLFYFEIENSNIYFPKYWFDYFLSLEGALLDNKINFFKKLFSNLYGIELNCFDNSLSGEILIIKNSNIDFKCEIRPYDFSGFNSEINILSGDFCIFNKNNDLILIPGISDNSKNFSENKEKIVFIGFLFENDFYQNSQIKIANREGIYNKIMHFYQRQSNFNIKNLLETSNNIKLLYDFNKDDFKIINMSLYDMIILFHKDSKLIYGLLDEINEMKKLNVFLQENFDSNLDEINDIYEPNYEKNEKIIEFFKYIYDNHIFNELISSDFVIEGNFEFSDKIKINIPSYRSDINSSIDIVSYLYKILVFENKISVVNDNQVAFFDLIETSSRKLNKLNDKRNFIYDENHEMNKFISMDEAVNFDLLYDGENIYNNKLYLILKSLSNFGFSEMIGFSFSDEEYYRDFIDQKHLVRLKSSINKTLNILRTNLLIGLLEKFKEISKFKVDDQILLFEYGPIFNRYSISERMISFIMGGNKFKKNIHLDQSFYNNKNFFDFYDAKFILCEILENLNISEDDLEFIRLDEISGDYMKLVYDKFNINEDINKNLFHPGKSAYVFFKNKDELIFIGYCGELNPFLLDKFDLIDKKFENIACACIYSDILNLAKKKNEPFISEFQSVYRDLALIFNEKIKISQIKNNIISTISANEKMHNQIHDLKIFDIFQNEALKLEQKKSIAFSFRICSNKKTLNDKEIQEIVNLILKNLEIEFGAYFAHEK